MTALFVVVIQDRHSDVDAEVFNTSDAAIAYAKEMSKAIRRDSDIFAEGLTEAMIRDGWIYFCSFYSEDGSSCLYAMKKMLNPALPE